MLKKRFACLRFKAKFCLLPLFLIISSISFSQQKIIANGTVMTEKDVPLSGVSVNVKGSSVGTITNTEGKFTLDVEKGVTLVFSFVGYETKEIKVEKESIGNVQISSTASSLGEVVVIGYGTQRKSDLTGSISQVKSSEINSYPSTNALQALSGRTTGVQVLQNTGAPGAPISVRIRGTNSIQGSNEPLYVIDGFPTTGALQDINNTDIESIEILKDASATAIYGSRGANGVVIITTNHGRVGKTRVTFESSYSTQSLRKKMDLMNSKEYATFVNETRINDNLQPYFTKTQIDSLGNGTDWQNLVFQNAPMKTDAFNVSGGDERTQFSLSGSVLLQDGIIKESNYNRYSLVLNINHKISNKFSVALSSVLTRIESEAENSQGGNRGSSLFSAAISVPPTLTPYLSDGSYRNMLTAYPFISNSLSNPINIINEQSNKLKGDRVLTNASLIFKPIPELTIKVSGGIENADDRNDTYNTTKFLNSQGSASVNTSQFTSLLNENTVTYSKTFNQKHRFSVLGGLTYQDFLNTSLGGSGNGFISDASQTFNLGSAQNPGIPTSSYSKSVLISYLGRINYSYDDKYLATVSIREDGSSKYSEGKKWGNFPSAALAWKISNEDFMRNIDFISDLKLRASWGYTGSQAINPYATLNQLVSQQTIFNDALFIAYAPGTVLPGNLKWETTEQKDVGIDFGIIDNRVSITADYYIKKTSNLLNTVQLPSSLGFVSTIQNVGEVQNKGFEFALNAEIFRGNFKWDVNSNISFNRNKVLKLYGGGDILGGFIDVNAVSDNTNILRVGQPIGMFWGYVEDGYNATGNVKYKDLNKDSVISPKDKTYIGNPNPKFIYGFNSNMSFKNFELNIFIQGSQGNDLFNVSSINSTVDYGIGLNMLKEVYLDHWTPDHINAKYPKPSLASSVQVSNRFIENGSYLRFKNIQLVYNLPIKKLQTKWIQKIQLYASAQNLITITKYSWWDPEVSSLGGANSTALGLDYYSYPTSKTVTFGVRIGL